MTDRNKPKWPWWPPKPDLTEEEQELFDNIEFNDTLIEEYASPETQAAFEGVEPDEMNDWTRGAIAELRAGERTLEQRKTYVGKIALVHRVKNIARLEELLEEDENV